MFFNEGRAVQIVGTLKCLTDSMCLTTPRLMTSTRWRGRRWTPSSRWRRRRRTPARRSRRPMILTDVLMMSLTSMVFSSWFILPSTVPSTTKPHCINVLRHVDRTQMSTTITTTYHVLVEDNSNQSDTS